MESFPRALRKEGSEEATYNNEEKRHSSLRDFSAGAVLFSVFAFCIRTCRGNRVIGEKIPGKWLQNRRVVAKFGYQNEV